MVYALLHPANDVVLLRDPRDSLLDETETNEAVAPPLRSSTPSLLALPWRDIWTNVPFLTLLIVHFTHNWAFYLMLSVVPSYFEQQFNVKYDEMGLVSVAPYLVLAVVGLICGPIADTLIKYAVRRISETGGECADERGEAERNSMVSSSTAAKTRATTRVRNFFTFLSDGSQATTLVLLALCHNEFWCCFLISVGVGFSGWSYVGFYPAYNQFSPRYSQHLMGIGNAIGGLPGIFGNLSVAAFHGNYSAVFLFAGVMQFLGMLPNLWFADYRDQRFGERRSVEREAGAERGGTPQAARGSLSGGEMGALQGDNVQRSGGLLWDRKGDNLSEVSTAAGSLSVDPSSLSPDEHERRGVV